MDDMGVKSMISINHIHQVRDLQVDSIQLLQNSQDIEQIADQFSVELDYSYLFVEWVDGLPNHVWGSYRPYLDSFVEYVGCL